MGRLSEVFVRAGGVLLCCPHTYKFSLHLCSFSARCLTDLLGPWDLGVVWLSQIASVTFLLALVHLVLEHGWCVLPGVPLVPGVRPRVAGTLVTVSRSSLGLFLLLVAWCLAVGPSLWWFAASLVGILLDSASLASCFGCACLRGWHLHGPLVCGFAFAFSFFARHSRARCLAFVFSQASFVSFYGSLDARVRTHTLALLLSRTLSLLPAGTHGPACPCGFSCGLFLLEFVPLFLCPSLSLLAQLCPSLGLLLAFGGGWESTPSGGCGCAAPGAFVFVCVVRFG